jgi:FAD:protein FMN transferase
MTTRHFRCMNTDVTVDAARDVEPWFRRVEATLTRFDPASPLSQLNQKPGRWVVVPPLLYRSIRAALGAARATGGAFDPTVLDALEATGYTRSLELGPTPPQRPHPAGRWREVRLDPHLCAAWLPPGVRLDLGGIGKSIAVDGALARLTGEENVLVNAGGDIALRTPADAPPALVDVADPFDPARTLATFGLHSGAVATSSTLGRRWAPGLHHLIDPRTGRPAASGLVAATVFATHAARAEVLAKAAIVLGREPGLALLRRHRCHGLLVTVTGAVILTEGLEEFRHGAA